MSTDIQLDKLKYKGDGRTIVQYQDADGKTEHTIVTTEPPLPTLPKALADMAGYVMWACAFHEAYSDGLTVSGVSLSHSDNGKGIVVTALKKLAHIDAPLVINTPHVLLDVVPSQWIDAIGRVESEAALFVDGARAQGTLPGTDDVLAKSVAAMCPKEGGDITSVEITHMASGQRVTLTSADGKNIAEYMRREKAAAVV